jgi:succinate dehydrogenase / fumarate reductase membrane anchor subunit
MSRVKGLGAAHHGVSHWWWQRLTAVAMIPLSIWFVYSLVTVMLSSDVLRVAEWFASPINTIMVVLLMMVTFFHAKLGMQVVIEDYIKPPLMKYFLLIGNVFLCLFLAIVSIMAVLKMHLLDIISGGVL